jgi:pimeloyl-ACP methyl ester carboxylesterase
MNRSDVTFFSAGVRCAAWLYRPANNGGDVPCVVMAHGFGLTRRDNLSVYAEVLARAGVAVLAYDHRHLGDSEGQPRQRIRMYEQLGDRLAAIAFARTLDGIDPDRIIVWGFSVSTCSAIEAAMEDERVAAAILLCPLIDARWRTIRGMRVNPRNAAWVLRRAVTDATIPVTGESGGRAALTFPGEIDGFRSIAGPDWRNEVSAGVALELAFYRPVVHARRVKCPVLIQAGRHDISVSARAVNRFARRAPRAVLKHYDVDHFGSFHSAQAAQIVADEVYWLRELESVGQSRRNGAQSR